MPAVQPQRIVFTRKKNKQKEKKQFNIRKSRSQLTPRDKPTFKSGSENPCEGLDITIY